MRGRKIVTTALAAAMASLARRAHSRRELEEKMRRKGFAADAVAEAVERLSMQGLLSDEEFAERWAARKASSLCSDRQIEQDLIQKGITRSVVACSLAKVREEISECDALARLLVKRLRGRELVTLDRKERIRLLSSLQRRGFSVATIMEVAEGQRQTYSRFPLSSTRDDYVGEEELGNEFLPPLS